MQIAIISDSHGSLDRLSEAVLNIKNGGIREIIHAGDFALGGVDEFLETMEKLNFRIALGNCDVNKEALLKIKNLPNVELADVLEFELGGRKFAVAHRIEDLRGVEADIFVSGHTHIPSAKNTNGKLFLNPGSLMDDGGYFLLETNDLKVKRKLFAEKL